MRPQQRHAFVRALHRDGEHWQQGRQQARLAAWVSVMPPERGPGDKLD
jgi:hypothetical protein